MRFQCFTSRPLVFQDDGGAGIPQFSTVVHIDYDEANACGFPEGRPGRDFEMTLEWRGRTPGHYAAGGLHEAAWRLPQDGGGDRGAGRPAGRGAGAGGERDALSTAATAVPPPWASIRNAPAWSGACGRWAFVLLGQVAGKVWATKIPRPHRAGVSDRAGG